MFEHLIASGTALGSVVLAATPTPGTDFDENLVTPTWVGFTATAVLALLILGLGWDLVRRIRRMRYRAEIQEELAAELAARDAAGAESGAEPEPRS